MVITTLHFISDLIKKYPRQLFLVVVSLFFLTIVEIASILVIAPLVDLITRPDLEGASAITLKLLEFIKGIHLPPDIYSIMIIMIAIAIFRAVALIVVNYFIIKIKYALIKDLYCGTYDDFFNSGWNFFVTHSQGMLGNTFSKEAAKIGDSFGHLATIFVKSAQVIFYFLIALWVSWKLASVVFILTMLCAVPFSFLGRYTHRYGKLNTETANRIFEVLYENLVAAKVIIGYGEERKGSQILEKSVNTHIGATLKSQLIATTTTYMFHPVLIGIILISIILSKTVINTPLSNLTVILYSFYMTLPNVGQVIAVKNEMLTLYPAYKQVNSLREKARKSMQISGIQKFNSFAKELHFSGINFSYPGHDEVLKEISFLIKKGEMSAFIGKSGAGKSTLIDLILRLYDPDSGVISIDGIDIKNFDINSWRHRIGYVPQESILFNISIKDNIKWAKDDATDADIVDAIKIAYVDEFLDELPDGMNTLVGDRGIRLSGGQKQRVALARAIVRKPEILILDEATSSLDSHSEKLIQDALEKISRQTTLIVVAHRLSTIINADKVFVIENGKIVEEGTFKDLCAQKGLCYKLAMVQGML